MKTTPSSHSSKKDLRLKARKDKDLINYIKENNGYVDTIQDKINNHMNTLDQKIAGLEKISKNLVGIYKFFSENTSLNKLHFQQTMNVDVNIFQNDFYQKIQEITTTAMKNTKRINRYQYETMQKEAKELESKGEDLENMINKTQNETMKETLVKKQKEADLAFNKKKKEIQAIIDTSALKVFISEEIKRLQEEKETKKRYTESLKDTFKRFSDIISYLEERAKRPENEKHFEEMKEKISTIDKDINEQKNLLNTYKNDPEMTKLINAIIKEFEDTKNRLNASSSKNQLESIKKNLGEETIKNLKLMDPISIMVQKTHHITLHDPKIKEIGNERINIENGSGETYCFNKKTNKLLDGNYKDSEEAELVRYILDISSRFNQGNKVTGALTISDSEIPECKNITTESGKIYNIHTKTKTISEGPATIIEKTKDKTYYYAGENIYCNDEVIVSSIISMKKIPNTSYIICDGGSITNNNYYTNNKYLIDIYKTEKQIKTVSFGTEECISPEELKEEYRIIYDKLKQKLDIIIIKTNNTQEMLFIDKKDNNMYVIEKNKDNIIDTPIAIVRNVEYNNTSKIKYLLNTDTGKIIEFDGKPISIKNIDKINDNISIISSDSPRKDWAIVGNTLIGGWDNDYYNNHSYKVYEPKGSKKIIIIKKARGTTDMSQIHIIEKDAPLGTFKTLDCYTTPHEDYYVIKKLATRFYVFDAKNNEIITDEFERYDEYSHTLRTPKKGIFSPEKKTKITNSGLVKL